METCMLLEKFTDKSNIHLSSWGYTHSVMVDSLIHVIVIMTT